MKTMLIFAFENLPSDTICSLLCIFVNAFDLIIAISVVRNSAFYLCQNFYVAVEYDIKTICIWRCNLDFVAHII